MAIIDLKKYTTGIAQSWSKPSGATFIRLILIGGGAPGGGGCRLAAATSGSGGAGGGGGAIIDRTYAASEFASSETYTVRATPAGFSLNNGTSNTADSFSMYLAGDATDNAATKLFLKGDHALSGSNYSHYGLSEVNNQGGTAVAQSFIWSDDSTSGHTYVTDTTGTNDWANGYLVLNPNLAGQSFSAR